MNKPEQIAEGFSKTALEQTQEEHEPIKYAKYFALSDAEGNFIKKNYVSGQLEIYEEEHQVPVSHKKTSCIEVFVTKTAPSDSLTEQMLETLKLLVNCMNLAGWENDWVNEKAKSLIAEAESLKQNSNQTSES